MNRLAISFTAPYRIYVPDEFFSVLTSSGTDLVKAVPLLPASPLGASKVNGTNFEAIHDIFGFAGRTRFHVLLNNPIDLCKTDWKISILDQENDLIEQAINSVNRLISVYRQRDINSVGRRSFHAINVVRHDLSDMLLQIVDENFDVVSGFSVLYPGFSSMGFNNTLKRADGSLDAIRSDLATDAEIPVERELLTSAENYLWRHQFRLVPIEANAAFEAFSLCALERIAPRNTLPETCDFLKKLIEIEKTLINSTSMTELSFARWFDPAIPGWRGLINDNLIQWHDNCYKLRNKVIHRGYNQIDHTEAEKALRSTISAISFIEEQISMIIV